MPLCCFAATSAVSCRDEQPRQRCEDAQPALAHLHGTGSVSARQLGLFRQLQVDIDACIMSLPLLGQPGLVWRFPGRHQQDECHPTYTQLRSFLGMCNYFRDSVAKLGPSQRCSAVWLVRRGRVHFELVSGVHCTSRRSTTPRQLLPAHGC
jgi:hypothetical protein